MKEHYKDDNIIITTVEILHDNRLGAHKICVAFVRFVQANLDWDI